MKSKWELLYNVPAIGAALIGTAFLIWMEGWKLVIGGGIILGIGWMFAGERGGMREMVASVLLGGLLLFGLIKSCSDTGSYYHSPGEEIGPRGVPW